MGRSKGEKIPGCKGNGGGKDWDYCYNPLHGGVKNLSGGNSGTAKNLQRCTGECDADSQCAYGLKCFQRSKGEPIPGCKGNGGGKDWDYCYDPKTEVKKPKKVVAYQVPDTRGGCPGKKGANQALISKKVTVSEASYVVATGHMIRRYSGRADLHLRLNNKIIDYSLTYTKTTQWQDANVYWVGSIAKGSHTFSITGNRANAFGCGSNWGDLDIIILPKLKDVAVYQFGVTQSGCPASNLNFRKTITFNQGSEAMSSSSLGPTLLFLMMAGFPFTRITSPTFFSLLISSDLRVGLSKFSRMMAMSLTLLLRTTLRPSSLS